jgi:aspartate kinase
MKKDVVYKFGGSSVKDAKAIERCCSIVLNHNPGAVVVSATYNTTNQLEALFRCVDQSSKEEFDQLQEEIIQKHLRILDDLGFPEKSEQFREFLSPILKKIEKQYIDKNTSAASLDEFYSLGEMMSSWIFHTKLHEGVETAAWVDSREWLKTDNSYNHAQPRLAQIKENVLSLNNMHSRPWVTQGFIGSTMSSEVTTLGREGSDYSATLLAEALSAKEVVIWTDVDGVYSADPRVVNDARKIPFLTYGQAELLAESGAKVLYSSTLAPAKRSGFRVRVASSIVHESQGTLISGEDPQDIFAITMKNYSESLDALTVVFPSSSFSSIQSELKGFETLRRTNGLWQGLVPSSTSKEVLKSVHAALLNSCV